MQTKAPPPIRHLEGRQTQEIVEAYFEINHLKGLLRQGWLRCGVDATRCESVAEHSFGVAMLTMIVADTYFPEIDRLKALRMAMLHDVGEVHAGDITPYHGVERAEKTRRERESISQVLGMLPSRDLYLALWDEYEAGDSPEARFVRAMDRLELVLQAAIYEHEAEVDLEEFFGYVETALDDPRLADIVDGLRKARRPGAAPARADITNTSGPIVDNESASGVTPEFFADPRLIVDEHGRDESRLRISVLNGTGLPLSVIVVSAELRYRIDDPEPFATLGPVTVESWEPPYFAAGVQTFEFDMSYPEEIGPIIDDVSINYVVVASEFRGVADDDLIEGEGGEDLELGGEP